MVCNDWVDGSDVDGGNAGSGHHSAVRPKVEVFIAPTAMAIMMTKLEGRERSEAIIPWSAVQ